ncbi:hypothetical protein SDC9_87923 [bioreactor metagenome]|uniref:Uncharacterized protein n=1 Tax=bioreactor metagenome TaxID=1076179 RepID=A0A644ZRK1_9ZZZZ
MNDIAGDDFYHFDFLFFITVADDGDGGMHQRFQLRRRFTGAEFLHKVQCPADKYNSSNHDDRTPVFRTGRGESHASYKRDNR